MMEIWANETCTVSWTFTGANGEAVTPASLEYQIVDAASGTVILAWTNVTPSAVTAITVTAAQNALVARKRETHQMQIMATDNLGNVGEGVQCWVVKAMETGCGGPDC